MGATQQKWAGRWEQFLGRVKRFFGQLTGNERLTLEGEYERHRGMRNEHAGLAREEFLEQLDRRRGD